MDDGTRPRVRQGPRAVWPELIAVVAAASVGVVVAAEGFPMALYASFADILLVGSWPPGMYAPALLAVAIAVPALLPRLPGWLVAAVGLAVFLVGGLVVADPMAVLFRVGPGTTQQFVAAFAGPAGLGLALGGVLLALAQSSPSVSWLVGAGLAGGLVLHTVSGELIRAVRTAGPEPDVATAATDGGWSRDLDVQLWLAVALVVAAVVVHSLRPGTSPAGSARPRPGVPLAVLTVTVLLLAGLALRRWLIREFRLDPAGSFHVIGEAPGPRGGASFALLSSVVLAAAAALLLAHHAHRAGGAPAVRWVLLGAAAGPVIAAEFPRPGSASPLLVLPVGLLAVAGGALAARYAPRLLPWDAVGLLVVAAAAATIWPPAGRPADAIGTLLVTAGLGLALGAGIVLVTGPVRPSPGAAPEADPADPADPAGPADSLGPADPAGAADRAPEAHRSGVLVLGPATAMLCATALAPALLRFQLGALREIERSFTVPLYAAAGAVLLVLVFGFARTVDRRRPPLPVEETAASS
ncbi:hypothetical protein [Micromonospora sp. NPDC126480]|uniref:hypothetical protein n=1 Tax=Micromonospora sp. NPDC126480 TaxID=3155312 RepID=UPI00331A1A5E